MWKFANTVPFFYFKEQSLKTKFENKKNLRPQNMQIKGIGKKLFLSFSSLKKIEEAPGAGVKTIYMFCWGRVPY